MVKAVIFDLDGVICSTDEYHYQAWKTLADKIHTKFDREINNRLRGVSRMESLEIILEKYEGEPFTQSEKERMAEEKNETYRKNLEKMSEKDLSAEVKETLEELRKRGYLLAIGSSSKNAPFILERIGLAGYFDAVADGNHITHSKPDPEGKMYGELVLIIEVEKIIIKVIEFRLHIVEGISTREEGSGFLMYKKEKIEKRLIRSFFTVSAIAAIAAIVGLVAIIVMTNRYSYALNNYGFAQGDIGRTMFEFADIRSSLRAAIGYDDKSDIDTVVQQHNETIAEFKECFDMVEDTIVSADGRTTYDAIKAELEDYWQLDAQIMELGATTDRELCQQAQELALNELTPAYNSIYDKLEGLLDVKVNEGNRLSATLILVSWILAAVVVVVIVISILSSMQLGRRIAKKIAVPLRELGGRLESFADGDLSTPFPEADTGDEVEEMGHHAAIMAEKLSAIIYDMEAVLGEMARGDYTVRSKISEKYTGDFQKMYQSMRGLRDQMTETLSAIGEASEQVQAGSGNLADASQNLAEGATEQAGAVQELHATISDITATMEKTAESADESYLRAQQYANAADNSREEMNTMMLAMERINETSSRIGDIISEIESIAAQTNLLSLNASIEAARAGEAGRGFAVVANEIRELADQSAKAAVDTRELIESSMKEVTEGNLAAERAAGSIETVVDGIKQIANFSRDLKVMVEGQTASMRQAEVGVNQISEVVQNNAATAEEASATSEELSAQAITLDSLVGQFKLKKSKE